MKISQTFVNYLGEEITEFRKTMQAKSAKEVYQTAFRIHFYEELYYFFCEEGDDNLSDRVVNALEKFSEENTEKVIALLYDGFIDTENSGCDNWEQICEFLESYPFDVQEESI